MTNTRRARGQLHWLQVVLLTCISFLLGNILDPLSSVLLKLPGNGCSPAATGASSAMFGAKHTVDHPLGIKKNNSTKPDSFKDLPTSTKILLNPNLEYITGILHNWLDEYIGLDTLIKDSRDMSEDALKGLIHEVLTAKTRPHTDSQDDASSQEKSSTGGFPSTVPRSLPNSMRRVPDAVNYLKGAIQVNRIEFNSLVDTGVPMDTKSNKDQTVTILYGSERTLPSNRTQQLMAQFATEDNISNPATIRPNDALKNCQQVGVIHIAEQSQAQPICWALVPGKESFHIQKWLRVSEKPQSKVDPNQPLRLVARGYDRNTGVEWPNLPTKYMTARHQQWLGGYLRNVARMVTELRPLVEKIANADDQLIVTVVNAGQSSLLMNFACAAQARGFSLKEILVFCIDKELIPMVKAFGMTPYYNEEFLGSLPSKDAKTFGDKTFTQVVIAKFMCTHLLSIMGYSFLFQDVDLVWYKHPFDFFNNATLAPPHFDMYFQDDRNNGIRYQPLRGNSGFYFVRHNARTVAALKDAVLKTDQLQASRSHQQTLLEVLHEEISYHGLRVKVFDGRDTAYFPLGEQFHRNKALMKALMNGDAEDVFLFHVNWTRNKNEKLAFLKQMGEWFVNDVCLVEAQNETSSGANVSKTAFTNPGDCCSAKPLFSCHYRDKPSIQPCKDSPAYENKKSWW